MGRFTDTDPPLTLIHEMLFSSVHGNEDKWKQSIYVSLQRVTAVDMSATADVLCSAVTIKCTAWKTEMLALMAMHFEEYTSWVCTFLSHLLRRFHPWHAMSTFDDRRGFLTWLSLRTDLFTALHRRLINKIIQCLKQVKLCCWTPNIISLDDVRDWPMTCIDLIQVMAETIERAVTNSTVAATVHWDGATLIYCSLAHHTGWHQRHLFEWITS